MKIHFVWPISVNKKMIFMSKILIESAKQMNAHFTILVEEFEYEKALNYFKNIAEVLSYAKNPEFASPWVATPKWFVEPKGDILLGLDSDTLVWNPSILLKYAEIAYQENTIYGTIAHKNPFKEGEWEKLFSQYKMKDNFIYNFHETGLPSPYYINNGAVLMPADLLLEFRIYLKKWLLELNKNYHNLFFISQVATTFAIKESGLPAKTHPKTFNYLETGDLSNIENDIENIAIFHYNESKNHILNLSEIKLNLLRNKLMEIQDKLNINRTIKLL